MSPADFPQVSADGVVTDGALIWTGTAWTNTLIEQANIDPTLALALRGAGSPEGAVTAPRGTAYLRTDGGAGTTLYIKESGTGSSGWVAK